MLKGAHEIVLKWYTQANMSWRQPSTILAWMLRVCRELGLPCTISIAVMLSMVIPVLFASFHLSLPLSMCFGCGFITAFKVALGLVLTPVLAWLAVKLSKNVLWPTGVHFGMGVLFMSRMMVQLTYLLGRMVLIDRLWRAAMRVARHD